MTEDSVKRPTIRLSKEEHKQLKIFCAEHDVSMQDFLRHAVLYCMDKGVLPEE